MARRALLQQQRGGLHARIGVEALHHQVARTALASATRLIPW